MKRFRWKVVWVEEEIEIEKKKERIWVEEGIEREKIWAEEERKTTSFWVEMVVVDLLLHLKRHSSPVENPCPQHNWELGMETKHMLTYFYIYWKSLMNFVYA